MRFILILFLLFTSSVSAQLFEFPTKDAQRLKGRTAVFILPDMEDMRNITDSVKKETQKYWITRLQNWLEKGAKKGWSAPMPLMIIKRSQVDSLPKDKLYLYMEMTSLRKLEYFWQYLMQSDSTIAYRNRKLFQDNQKFAYMQLRFSERNDPFYTWYFFSLVPTQLDLYVAMKSMSTIIQRSLANPKSKTKNIEEEIRNRNATLKSRTLLMDSSMVNRSSKTFEYIPEEYKEPYQLTSHHALEQRIMSGDESGAVFFMVPITDPVGRGESYTGTSGGGMVFYDKTYFYMQLILDLGTGNFLYYDKCEEPRVLVRDWRRFTRYTDEDPDKGSGK